MKYRGLCRVAVKKRRANRALNNASVEFYGMKKLLLAPISLCIALGTVGKDSLSGGVDSSEELLVTHEAMS